MSGWYKSTVKAGVHGLLEHDRRQRRLLLPRAISPLAERGRLDASKLVDAGDPRRRDELSVGMGITGGSGSATMDDFLMYDNAPAPDTTPPTSSYL